MRRGLWVVVFALALGSCSRESMMQALAPQQEEQAGRQFLENVRTRNFPPVEQRLDPAYKTPALRAQMEKMAAMFPPGPPRSIKLVGSNTVSFSGAPTTYNLTFEYEFPGRWLLGHVYFRKADRFLQIEQIDVQPLRDSLENFNAFNLAGRSLRSYAFLALAMLIPAFIILTAIACWRSPYPKRKWLWRIFVLLGIVTFSLNWTTGDITYRLIGFNLLGAGFSQVPYGPVILQIGFPLGAILFWIRRRGWVKSARAA